MRSIRASAARAVAVGLSAVALSVSSIAAQDVTIGIRSGAAFGGFAGLSGMRARPGYVLGPTVSVGVSPWLAIHTELLWARYGTRYTSGQIQQFSTQSGGVFSITPAQNASMHFLQLPVLGRFDFGRLIGGPVRPTLYVGPQASALLACSVTDMTSAQGSIGCNQFAGNEAFPTSPFNNMRRFDVGAIGGVGLEIDLFKKIQLATDVRYQRGFGTMNALDRRFYNQAWSVMFQLSAIGDWGTQGAFLDGPSLPMQQEPPKGIMPPRGSKR